ncbi:hypothetical protein TCAL_08316 [Tigriopus californicus]|uniref:Pyridine nucleotide-disulfide oxidoreductase domain-containing protein 2 n=2 Tax=Tigriopus californicus TaxID=6832 RepID=A0A553P9X2_TIGCA|nr:hypothetical protein TCAL_08316 [Tigriopus californicus]|eukprot:TCALIF_08316-PA protein Name:"Similar to PYROXD2 Pyridine nucleotide-disulfide oxidoreductase domain-containing protein 2 (Bos taurus)" AED:0.34 eAED:0.34 QI:0/-1/0/1/-1/1/1/0/540
MAKSGMKVAVFERRYLVGGAAVTEEIVPGFRFSRASYVLSLLRPQIMSELKLADRGLKVHLRDPSSYTPIREELRTRPGLTSLTLGQSTEMNRMEIGKFSSRDSEAYEKFEDHLGSLVDIINPLLDHAPLDLNKFLQGSLSEKCSSFKELSPLWQAMKAVRKVDLEDIQEMITSPTSKILDVWFESDPLKATLATDACIGAMASPSTPGSGYVLLHHVMGGLNGVRGAWGYPEGGMGSVSNAIGDCAVEAGAQIFTDSPVESIDVTNQSVTGITIQRGGESLKIKAPLVLSNATPKVTFCNLLAKPQDHLPQDVLDRIEGIDYTSPVTKLNFAVNRLPNFEADPNQVPNEALPLHQSTIHLNCENMSLLEDAYASSVSKQSFSALPMIEMTIPSVLDSSLAPPGQHVCLVFSQYTPYDPLPSGWDAKTRDLYANLIVDTIESYAPGFRASIVGYEMLTPPDLESIFGLTGGNIFHGSMSLDQLYLSRPTSSRSMASPGTPIQGLLLAGSGAHPGGGVMGSPGRLAAKTAVEVAGKSWTFA